MYCKETRSRPANTGGLSIDSIVSSRRKMPMQSSLLFHLANFQNQDACTDSDHAAMQSHKEKLCWRLLSWTLFCLVGSLLAGCVPNIFKTFIAWFFRIMGDGLQGVVSENAKWNSPFLCSPPLSNKLTVKRAGQMEIQEWWLMVGFYRFSRKHGAPLELGTLLPVELI